MPTAGNASDLRDLVLRSTRLTFHPDSPLYVELGRQLADDAELLEIVARVPKKGPLLNLFFAAVQYLQLENPQPPLADFYPSVSGRPRAEGDPYPAFREYVLSHRQQIERIFTTRRVQTNETGRCAVALPVYGLVAERSRLPLALVEVGCSGGLNLVWDRYRYTYRSGRGRHEVGVADSRLELRCEVRGAVVPPLPTAMPTVVGRIGLDLDPIDVTTADGALWARSMLWPDQPERHRRMLSAIAEFRAAPVQLISGDAVDDLNSAISALPDEAALCVLHTFMLSQLSAERRGEFDEVLAAISHHRPVYRISNEWLTREGTRLELVTYRDGKRHDELLARNHPHGAWIEWLASS